MPHIKSVFRYAITVAATVALAPVIGEFFIELAKENGAYDQPTQKINTALIFLAYLADLPGFKLLAGFTAGLATGLWANAIAKKRNAVDVKATEEIDRLKLADEADALAKDIGALVGQAAARESVAWQKDARDTIISYHQTGLPSFTRKASTEESARLLEKYGEKYHADVWRVITLAGKCIQLEETELWRIRHALHSAHEIYEIAQFLSRLAVNLRYPSSPDLPLIGYRHKHPEPSLPDPPSNSASQSP